ncbi:hypothetical protein [Mesobacillus zeae]|uniref:Uncharacterized protein n=1 Tax=Mesobacillus zeae TaxID=1917180 RepID=A0A398B467_9BACI|nr:hypothetical protein [Mesobacillus zeae]RID84632.1 hypothetical protein D1970_12140 [Mesobacillus zeae]
MDFILEHKWIFLIVAEAVFWISVLTFLTLRYWFRLKKLSLVFFLLFIVNDMWIAAMGFMDYLNTGEFTRYQVIILIFLVYALTYGKTDFKRLDVFIQRKVAKWKGEPVPELTGPATLYGKAHARRERKSFSIHFLIFILVHIILFLLIGPSDFASQIESSEQLLNAWFSEKEAVFPFEHSDANNFSRIWTIILVIDAVVSLSYTFFPKSEKKSASTDS